MIPKFRFVRQLDSEQCGAACLAMICNHYGLRMSLSQIERHCHITAEGASMKAISDGAEDLGFITQGARINVDRLPDLPMPVVLHWKGNHFVVLYHVDSKTGRYYIADPGFGKRKLTEAQFLEGWRVEENDKSGHALFLVPGENFKKSDSSRLSIGGRQNISRAGSYMKAHRKGFTVIILTLIFTSLLQMVMPLLTQAIVDKGIAQKSISLIWLILIGEIAIVIAMTVSDYIRQWWVLHISTYVNISMLSDFFSKLIRLPMSFFDSRHMGDLLQRMSDHSRVQMFITENLLMFLFAVVGFIVFSIILILYDFTIWSIFIAGAGLRTVWVCLFLRKRREIDFEQFAAAATNNNITYDFIDAMPSIKIHNCGNRRRTEWENAQQRIFKIRLKSLKLDQCQNSGALLISELQNLVITVIAASGVINGDLTIGAMMAIQIAVGQAGSPFQQILHFVQSLQDVKISFERIGDIHDTEDENKGRDIRVDHNTAPDISVRNLTFSYDRHAEIPTIDNVTFDIPSGKVTAIVGASGSGKSTIIKMLLGYYAPRSGSIVVNGTDLQTIDIDDWRNICGIVMQEGCIFSDTIENNIAPGSEAIDRDRLIKAVDTACIRSFIESLPLGYKTRIGRDGVGLSIGQKQRILIARAAYANPKLIILDEATNSLDAENEKSIVSNLNAMYSGRTVVVVAHRLSTVMNADNIIVLDKGRIVESGNHERLIALGGIYFNLVSAQLEL